MPPSEDVASQSLDGLPATDEPSKAKRIIRYLVHLYHFFITLLLALTIVLIEIHTKKAFWILYLVPFIITILIVEAIYLIGKTPPKRLQETHFAPKRLIRRSFIYQAAAVFLAAWIANYPWDAGGFINATALFLMWVVIFIWVNGVALFVLAACAREYNFIDWVEDPRPETEQPIRLDSEPEPEVRSGQNDDDHSDNTAMLKRRVRYFLHMVHFSVAIVLLYFIWKQIRSYTASPNGIYLLPLIFLTVSIEICHLLHRRPPKRLLPSFFLPPALINRAFVYQLAGAYAMVNTGYVRYNDFYNVRAAFNCAFIVWIIGVVLFAIAIASQVYGFEDWVEDPELREGREYVGMDEEEPVHSAV